MLPFLPAVVRCVFFIGVTIAAIDRIRPHSRARRTRLVFASQNHDLQGTAAGNGEAFRG
jgi:hypothetical protein